MSLVHPSHNHFNFSLRFPFVRKHLLYPFFYSFWNLNWSDSHSHQCSSQIPPRTTVLNWTPNTRFCLARTFFLLIPSRLTLSTIYTLSFKGKFHPTFFHICSALGFLSSVLEQQQFHTNPCSSTTQNNRQLS